MSEQWTARQLMEYFAELEEGSSGEGAPELDEVIVRGRAAAAMLLRVLMMLEGVETPGAGGEGGEEEALRAKLREQTEKYLTEQVRANRASKQNLKVVDENSRLKQKVEELQKQISRLLDRIEMKKIVKGLDAGEGMMKTTGGGEAKAEAGEGSETGESEASGENGAGDSEGAGSAGAGEKREGEKAESDAAGVEAGEPSAAEGTDGKGGAEHAEDAEDTAATGEAGGTAEGGGESVDSEYESLRQLLESQSAARVSDEERGTGGNDGKHTNSVSNEAGRQREGNKRSEIGGPDVESGKEE